MAPLRRDEHRGRPQTISAFRIISPSVLYARRTAIQQTILAAIDPGLPPFVKPNYDFEVDPVCGWIRYALRTDLWSAHPKRGLPRDERAATAAAVGFIDRLAAACNEPDYRALAIPPLLPTEAPGSVMPVSAYPVSHPQRRWPDHWLCRFSVRIDAPAWCEDRDTLPVVGATIDVRVGHKGKVVGLASHWRPAWLDRPVPARYLAHEETHADAHLHAGGHDPAPHAVLAYVSAGENSPQTLLAPYHHAITGHHGQIGPASDHSLTVSMLYAVKEEGGAHLLPVVAGGSDDYTTTWAYWRPEAIFDEGLVPLGKAETIELPPGVYSVMLHVEDNQTGAVALCERMTYVGAAAGTAPALAGPA